MMYSVLLSPDELIQLFKKQGYKQCDNYWQAGEAGSLHPDLVPHQIVIYERKLEVNYRPRFMLVDRDKALLQKKYSCFEEHGEIIEVASHNRGSLYSNFAHMFYSLSSLFIGLFFCLLTLWLGVTFMLKSSFTEALLDVTRLTEIMDQHLAPFPGIHWYENLTTEKAFGGALILSFMMTFIVGFGVGLGFWLSETFKVYAKAAINSLWLWPLLLLGASFFYGGSFVDGLLWAFAAVMVAPGYLMVLSWRYQYAYVKKKTFTLCAQIILPFLMASILFGALIAVKLPFDNMGGIDSALIVRDDILKTTKLGTRVSDFYYNNVIAANLFVRSGGEAESLEQSTLNRLRKNNLRTVQDFKRPDVRQQAFRSLLKDQGAQLLQLLGLPLLMLWAFSGLLTLLAGVTRGSWATVGGVLAVVVTVVLFVLPLYQAYENREALKWYRYRGSLDGFLHEVERLSGQVVSGEQKNSLIAQDLKILKGFDHKKFFSDINRDVNSENVAVRAMSAASLEAFVAIRYHLMKILPRSARKAPHRLPDAFFDEFRKFQVEQLPRLIRDKDELVSYWALHLAYFVDGLSEKEIAMISEAVRERAADKDVNLRDQVVLALGHIVAHQNGSSEKEMKLLMQRQGEGEWKNSPESCDYVKIHLFNVLLDNWKKIPLP